MIRQFNCPACGAVAGAGEYAARSQTEKLFNGMTIDGELIDPTQPPGVLLGFCKTWPSIQEATFLCPCGAITKMETT